MSNWDKLSMREKAAYIKVGVQNGLTSISDIKEYYDRFQEVNASAGDLVNAINENTKSEIYLGRPSHNYDFTQSEEWANKHGYYPDSRGHRDDRVKKPAHPTHPSRGTFRSMNEFELSDIGIQDPNYTLYGLNDGGQDPQARMIYDRSIVLPELTVTPQGNYVYNSYDNVVNKFGGGGFSYTPSVTSMSLNQSNPQTPINYTFWQGSAENNNTHTPMNDYINSISQKRINNYAAVETPDSNLSTMEESLPKGGNEEVEFTDIKQASSKIAQEQIDQKLNFLKTASRQEIKKIQQQLLDEAYAYDNLNNYSYAEVKKLQRKLVRKGYLKQGKINEIDGIVGPKTKEAYQEYVKNTFVDRIFGKNTEKAFLKSIKNSNFNWNNDPGTKMQDGCAKWVTKKWESVGNNSVYSGVILNAWQMPKAIEDKGGTMLLNLYDDPLFDNIENVNQLRTASEKAIKNNRGKFDYNSLEIGDVVGMYLRGSSSIGIALKEGTTYNSHVGIVVGYNENGEPIIEHKMPNGVRRQPVSELQNKITVISRPRGNKATIPTLNFTPKDSQYEINSSGTHASENMRKYMNAIAGSKETMQKLFPKANVEEAEKIAIAVQKRETNYMTDTNYDWYDYLNPATHWHSYIRPLVKEIVRKAYGLDNYTKSSNLAKIKLSSFSPEEQKLLGLQSPEDLENPQKAGVAAMFLMCKNYDYLQRLREKNPNLNMSEQDVIDATILSYNQGMTKLKSIGFDEQGNEDSSLESLRSLSTANDIIPDISSSDYRHAEKLGDLPGKIAEALYYSIEASPKNSYIYHAKKNFNKYVERKDGENSKYEDVTEENETASSKYRENNKTSARIKYDYSLIDWYNYIMKDAVNGIKEFFNFQNGGLLHKTTPSNFYDQVTFKNNKFKEESQENQFTLTPFKFKNTTVYRNDNTNTYYADDKGTISLKDDNNDMLYAYYNEKIKGMSNEDIINFYNTRYRALQDKWMAASKPLEYNTRSPKIEVTKGKSSGVLVPTAMIDSIVSHTKAHNYTVNKEAGLVDDPYTALAVASVETDFGKHLNHGSLVNQSGLTPAIFNDERYYLPDQSYYAGLSTALRNYYNELSKTQKMDDKQENFVKHYLDLKNLFNDPKAVEYVGNALKKDLIYKRFKNYTAQDLLPPPNVYDHILKEIYSGKYNSGNANYNSNVRKNAEILRSDPNVKRYVQKAVKKYDDGGPTNNTTFNKVNNDGVKKQAWVRYFRDIPEEFRDPRVNYEKEKNTKIWTDEYGRPINRADLINYDTSKRLLFAPTPNSQFDQPQVNHYNEAFINQEKRKQKAIQERQTTRDVVSSALDFVPIVGDIKGGYEGILQPLQQGNYLTAGLGAGMLLLPNFIEKPFKWVGKGAKKLYNRFKNKTDIDLPTDIDFKFFRLPPIEDFPKPKIQYEFMADPTKFWNTIFKPKYDTNRLKFNTTKTTPESLPGKVHIISKDSELAIPGANGHSNKGDTYIYKEFMDVMDPEETVIHEAAHNFRDTNPKTLEESINNLGKDINKRNFIDDSKYTSEEIDALDNAYTFTSDFSYNNIHESYLARLAEKSATNTELQYAIWKQSKARNISELNAAIDKLSDDDILYMLQQTNGYGRDFVKYIASNPDTKSQAVSNIREALKYVPVATGAVGYGGYKLHENLTNNNKSQ